MFAVPTSRTRRALLLSAVFGVLVSCQPSDGRGVSDSSRTPPPSDLPASPPSQRRVAEVVAGEKTPPAEAVAKAPPAQKERPADKSPASSARDEGAPLTVKQFEEVRSLVAPSKDEAVWMKVKWVTTLWEAQERAAKEGKPIACFCVGGEPLGIC
jgi:hypothetical protein